MFIFYDIECICFLNKLQQLELIAADGYEIYVPLLQLENYSESVKTEVQLCQEKGFLKYITSDVFQSFLEKNNLVYSHLGKGFLFLLHCCLENNLVLVINKNNFTQNEICERLGIKTISIKDFSKEVIRNEKYYDFLIMNKDKIII